MREGHTCTLIHWLGQLSCLGPVSDQLLISASDQQQQCERHLRCYLARGLRTSQLMAAV